ncbi:MAG: hypothetical protein U9O95_07320, partial [Candidatus Marinimicrobia bacterium]|nr:hypothetical protein [Candidatus Neomarinimicrobiota bacterium]
MIQFDLTSSRILWAFTLILALFLIFWLFRNRRNNYYTKTIKNILSILRVSAIIIFILILLDIKINFARDKQVKPEIAFLWDLSESMFQADSSYNVRNILNSRSYRNIAKKVNISHISEMQIPRIVSETQLKNSLLKETISDNGKLLRFAEEQARFKELILVSDGRSYLGEPLESIHLTDGLKVHVIGIGEKITAGLPILRSVNFPEYIMQGDSIRLSWLLQNSGDKNMNSEVFIRRDGKEVFRERVLISAQRMLVFEQTFPSANEGISDWKWFIESKNEDIEIGTKNIYIHPSALRVLCYANPPDQDIAMASTVLLTSDRYQVYNIDEWKTQFPENNPDLVIQTWHSEDAKRIYPNTPAILFLRDKRASYQTSSELKLNIIQPYVYFVSDISENARFWTQLPPIQVAHYSGKEKLVMKTSKGDPVILEDFSKGKMIINASGLWRWNLAGYEKDWNGIYRHMIEEMVETLIRRNRKNYIALDEKIYMGIAY